MKAVVILQNIEKNTNLGQLIRTCNALGVAEVCVVGRKKYSSYGNQNTHSTTKIRHFFDFPAAHHFYKSSGYKIAAVEISEASQSINTVRFSCNTAFILGNEGQGIPAAVLALSDYCVYIPQYGNGASVNVNVACGVVLNTFMAQSDNTPNTIERNKFLASTV